MTEMSGKLGIETDMNGRGTIHSIELNDSNSSMDVSIIICTFNRANFLRGLLQVLTEQIVPANIRWEVIVVDNRSDDDTALVAKAFANKFAHLRYEYKEKAGISYARNHGIECAKSELICFLDDDILIGGDHIKRCFLAFKCGQWDIAGGRVLPRTSSVWPNWIKALPKEALNGPLGLYDKGKDNFILSENDERVPITANILVRRHVIDKVGLFDTNLGRVKYSLRSGEDSDFCQRARDCGLKIGYCGSCVVYHRVPRKRLSRIYFLRWKFVASITGSNERLPKNTVFWLGIPRFVWGSLFRGLLVLVQSIYKGGFFFNLIRVVGSFGAFIGYINGVRRRKLIV